MMHVSFTTRLWLAWKVLRGQVTNATWTTGPYFEQDAVDLRFEPAGDLRRRLGFRP